MYSVTWIDAGGSLHSVSTPNEAAAGSLYWSLREGWFVVRLWHTAVKGRHQLLA